MSKEQARARRILKFFKLTIPEWDAIEAWQSLCCFICGNKQKSGKRLATDHSHHTGLVRGLLCSQCNRALGRIERDYGLKSLQILLRLALYLQNPPAVQALQKEVFTFAGRFGTNRHREHLGMPPKKRRKRKR